MENERVEKRQARQAVYDGLAFHKIAFEVTEHKASAIWRNFRMWRAERASCPDKAVSGGTFILF